MITKTTVTDSLKKFVGQGQDDLTAIQHTFEELMAQYCPSSDYEDRKQVLCGIFAFAGEMLGRVYGYREFDLVLGRAFPDAETLRGISEEEGENLYS